MFRDNGNIFIDKYISISDNDNIFSEYQKLIELYLAIIVLSLSLIEMYLSINMFLRKMFRDNGNIFIDKYISINDNDKTIITNYHSIKPTIEIAIYSKHV